MKSECTIDATDVVSKLRIKIHVKNEPQSRVRMVVAKALLRAAGWVLGGAPVYLYNRQWLGPKEE